MWKNMSSWKKALILIGVPMLIAGLIFAYLYDNNEDFYYRVRSIFDSKDEIDIEEY